MVDQCYIVRFEKRTREFWSMARLRIKQNSKPEGNRLSAVFNEGQGVLAWSHWCRYPKPVDLCLSRMKPLEGEVEVRTSSDVQIVWMTWV